MDKLFFVGCGGVGFCLLELIAKHKLFKKCKITIIEPREIPNLEDVLTSYNYIQVKDYVKKENYRQLLGELDSKSFLINVSVNVDSIMLIKLSVEKGTHYIDTSLEMYEDHFTMDPEKINSYADIVQNNLFHQNLLAIEAQGKDKRTRLISNGMNPGLISHFAKKTLKTYARSKGMKFTPETWKGDYAKLAHTLGLTEIQIVEYDTQKFVKKAKTTKNCFSNTWSSLGLQEEASDNAMLSLNDNDKTALTGLGYKLIHADEKVKNNIYFLQKRGMNIERLSKCLDYEGKPFEYVGKLIPHAETISLSSFFSYRGKSPSVMYVYRCCDEALRGLDFFRENNYNNLPDFKVVRNSEITSGWDSIGTLLKFSNGDQVIGSTVVSNEDVKAHGLRSGATTVQVACYMLPCIMWAIRNRNKGINNAETIPHKQIFRFANKYLGKTYFKLI